MCVIENSIQLSAPALSAGRRAAPSPLWAIMAADRAIALPRRAAEHRSRALVPVLRRPPAHNAVAAERLFRAVGAALGSEVAPRRAEGIRHRALECTAFAPEPSPGCGAGSEPGLSLRRLVVLAGKHVDWRFGATVLHVTHHAAVRFAERSRRVTPEALLAAAEEAARVADAVLLAHLDGPLSVRLEGGTAAILLPAGPGAFLGFLRLIARDHGAPEAHLEASTWLHEADLAGAQVAALEFCRAGLPAGEMLQHMPEAFRGLRPGAQGDRRVAAGLRVAGLPRQGGAGRIATLSAPAPSGARLRLGLACADTVARDHRKGTRA